MPASNILVTGAFSADRSHPPSRLEINTFVKHEKVFSLYVQALYQLYEVAQADTLSYFQISGIHGKPFIDWSGSESYGEGYCAHNTPLFATWHRPYLAVFEQEIQKHALQIASRYSADSALWLRTAEDLRQPYWDWASNITLPAEVISMPELLITAPEGKKLVQNPFLHYQFRDKIEQVFKDAPYIGWKQTIRHPNSREGDAEGSLDKLADALSSIQAQVTLDTLRLFSMSDFHAFCTKNGTSGGSTNSLESIHDMIHNAVGGMGHMSDTTVAAFDPIFWMHHAQIDRLLSLWSCIHSKWVPDSIGKEDLRPFWKTPSTYWKSEEISNSGINFNYTYPELIRVDLGLDLESRSDTIASTVCQLYGEPSASKLTPQPDTDGCSDDSATLKEISFCDEEAGIDTGFPSKRSSSNLAAVSLHWLKLLVQTLGRLLFQTNARIGSPGLNKTPSACCPKAPQITTEWSVRISCNQNELGQSFSVVVFFTAGERGSATSNLNRAQTISVHLEQPSSDPVLDTSRSRYYGKIKAGSFDVFVNSSAHQCGTCKKQANTPVQGFVHLHSSLSDVWTTLVAKYNSNSTHEDEILRFLKDHLSYSVRKIDGSWTTLESLEIVLIATPLASGRHVPVAGQPRIYRDVEIRLSQ
ncbi:hypothetical protein VKT23_015660 [Stygiomarasmius scandens]|uniref:tyrosinase n=1 Tax=Marasmiellus scandens TaxID=2682957 RepID=A0ABR1IWX6_9AGAR